MASFPSCFTTFEAKDTGRECPTCNKQMKEGELCVDLECGCIHHVLCLITLGISRFEEGWRLPGKQKTCKGCNRAIVEPERRNVASYIN